MIESKEHADFHRAIKVQLPKLQVEINSCDQFPLFSKVRSYISLYLAVFKEIERAAVIAAAMVTAIMETIRVPKKRFLPQTRLDWARWESPHQGQFNRKGKVISKCKDVWSGSADINMGIHVCKVPNKMITVKDLKALLQNLWKKRKHKTMPHEDLSRSIVMVLVQILNGVQVLLILGDPNVLLYNYWSWELCGKIVRSANMPIKSIKQLHINPSMNT